MVASAITSGNALTKRINIFFLLAAIILVLVLPLKKEIWYDETVSILCSKGISHDTHVQLEQTNQLTSAEIDAYNNSRNVFKATVNDNANSYLYNYGLHWFNIIFGNNVAMYMLFSKLCAIATLIAFYVLSNLFFRNSLFTSLAVGFLATDLDFLAMSHEIRAYAMGIFFVVMTAIYVYRFLYEQPKPFYLFLAGMFTVGAILSHFLVVYMILLFLLLLIVVKKGALFSIKNILVIAFPLALLGFFFYSSYKGLQVLGLQNKAIQDDSQNHSFEISKVIIRSMKYMASDFKAVIPSFINSNIVVVLSSLFIFGLYIAGLKITRSAIEKRNLHLLFIAGICNSVFLGLLSIKAQQYTALYYRYYCFGLPFSCLFVAYVLYIFSQSPKVNKYITGGILMVLGVPSVALLISNIKHERPTMSYNHPVIAKKIMDYKTEKLEVPEWRSAFLVQSFLPEGYKIDYFRKPEAPYFVIYKADGLEKIEVIKADL